jgi:hypothetical protein
MARILPSLCIVAALGAACTTLAEPDGMIRSSTVAIGSSFVRSVHDSGSYGKGPSTTTVTRAPNREWQGQTVAVWQQTVGPTLLLLPENGAFVGLVNGEQPLVSFEPPMPWPWPMKVGQGWTRNFTMHMHASGQRVPVEVHSVVEAYEDVAMPAGTFKAFRIRTVDSVGNEDVQWFSTELTVFLKQRLTRTARHPAGPGVRETELLSQSIRHR